VRGFRRAAELLHGARQREFYGLGGSAQIARDVAHKFLRIGIQATTFDDTHAMAMSASLLQAGDVCEACEVCAGCGGFNANASLILAFETTEWFRGFYFLPWHRNLRWF
jgi:hypothetical protein